MKLVRIIKHLSGFVKSQQESLLLLSIYNCSYMRPIFFLPLIEISMADELDFTGL
jgi:hypothetical protein